MQVRSNGKIGRQLFEAGFPCEARVSAGAVACGAMAMKELFAVYRHWLVRSQRQTDAKASSAL